MIAVAIALPRLVLGLLVGLEPGLIDLARAAVPLQPRVASSTAAGLDGQNAGRTLAAAARDADSDSVPAGSPPLLSAPSGVTALAGRVLQTDGRPLAGVIQATPADIGAARYGNVAMGGAVFLMDQATGAVVPDMVGTTSQNGPPTNSVTIILDQSGNVVTMFPSGPFVPFQGK